MMLIKWLKITIKKIIKITHNILYIIILNLNLIQIITIIIFIIIMESLNIKPTLKNLSHFSAMAPIKYHTMAMNIMYKTQQKTDIFISLIQAHIKYRVNFLMKISELI